MDPHQVAAVVHLDDLVGEAPVGGAVGAPDLLVEAARLDDVVEGRPQEGAAEAKVEGLFERRVEEDGHAPKVLQRAGQCRLVVLLDVDARAADPLHALRQMRLLLGDDRVLVPLDGPAHGRLVDDEWQNVADDQHRRVRARRGVV